MIRYASIKPSATTPDFKNNDVSAFWFEALKDIPTDALGRAMNKLLQSTFFPCIEDVKKSCGVVEFTDDEIAREFVPKIVNYVERFGYVNAHDARKAMGEDRWDIILALGGWEYVCQLEYEEFTFLLPQWRETAKVVIKKKKLGMSMENLHISGAKTDRLLLR